MTDWVAACMEPDEWRLWQQANRTSGGHRVDRPCRECPLGFALEMRAINRCNGEPSGAPEADEQEDEPMEVARPKTKPLTVSVTAPCETCIHREVCAIRKELSIEADVDFPVLSPALKPTVSVVVECSFYVSEKAVRKAPSWTPEQRQAQAARLADMRARKVARAAEREASEAA